MDHVAALLVRYGIAAETHSEGETLLAFRPRMHRTCMEMPRKCSAFTRWMRVVCETGLAERGFASPEFHGALTTPIGFALNPADVLGLARAALGAGGRLHRGHPLIALSRDGGRHLLTTPGGQVRAGRR